MKYQPTHQERQTIRQIIKENDLWLKNAGEYPNSLMRAISNALYFTDVHHEALQHIIVNYFKANYKASKYKFFSTQSFKLAERFLEDPSQPEFALLTLEIASIVFQKRFKLFYIQDETFCSQIFFRKTESSYNIFRFNEQLYAAVFKRPIKHILPFVQNMAISIIDSVAPKRAFEFRDYNDGRFINIEYEWWLQNLQDSSSKLSDGSRHNRRGFNYSCNKSTLSASNNSYSMRFSDKFSTNSGSLTYNDDQLSAILANRRTNRTNLNAVFMGPGQGPDTRANPHGDTRVVGEAADFSVFADKPQGLVTRDKFSCFTNKVQVENDNLQKEISGLKMQNLFGFAAPDNDSMISSQSRSSRMRGLRQDLFNDPEPLFQDRGSTQYSAKSSRGFEVLPHDQGNERASNQDSFSKSFALNELSLKPVINRRASNSQVTLAPSSECVTQSDKTLQKVCSQQQVQKILHLNEKIDDLAKQNWRATGFETAEEMRAKVGLPILSRKDLSTKDVHIGTLTFYDKKKGFGLLSAQTNSMDSPALVFVLKSQLLKAGLDLSTLNGFMFKSSFKFRFEIEQAFFIDSIKMTAVNLNRTE